MARFLLLAGFAAMNKLQPPCPGDALLIVDVQNDFLPGGALAVQGGDRVVPALNRYIELFSSRSLSVFATRDWHPAHHCSFVEHGGPWPAHCIAGSSGAELSAQLELPATTRIVSKGTTAEADAYSGFAGTDLGEQLRAERIERLFIGGLATEICVLETVKEALEKGFGVVLLCDAICALNEDEGRKAQEEMARRGAVLLNRNDLE